LAKHGILCPARVAAAGRRLEFHQACQRFPYSSDEEKNLMKDTCVFLLTVGILGGLVYALIKQSPRAEGKALAWERALATHPLWQRSVN